MTNHPNRNWRSRMQRACAEFLARWPWRTDGQRMLSDDDLRGLMGQAYVAGYTDRHTRDRTSAEQEARGD